ncbi:MAG: nucleoside deaminase [Oscillospiraceae bacterium]|nr:nucleoside deaminase [Oscillospiraceae bacterium]
MMMREAINEANAAAALGEVPIGAVIAQNGVIIARGHNLRETDKHALAHAEIVAINEACKKLGGWRLPNCTLYVTLEPCPMCAGAIINSRIDRVVFGAFDPKAGSLGSLIDLSKVPYNHSPQLCGGVLQEECADLLKNFFKSLRNR